jgi:hypothetical protein
MWNAYQKATPVETTTEPASSPALVAVVRHLCLWIEKQDTSFQHNLIVEAVKYGYIPPIDRYSELFASSSHPDARIAGKFMLLSCRLACLHSTMPTNSPRRTTQLQNARKLLATLMTEHNPRIQNSLKCIPTEAQTLKKTKRGDILSALRDLDQANKLAKDAIRLPSDVDKSLQLKAEETATLLGMSRAEFFRALKEMPDLRRTLGFTSTNTRNGRYTLELVLDYLLKALTHPFTTPLKHTHAPTTPLPAFVVLPSLLKWRGESPGQ